MTVFSSVFKHLAIGTLAAAPIIATPNFAAAQSGTFELELNNASESNGGCRLTYVATNNTGIALERTAYEVAIFDAEGVVSRILVLEFGKLAVGKTKVVQFDLAETPCDGISRIIVNNLAECASAEGSHDFCIEALVTNSRNDIQFGV